ncbi:MAG: hypothetical protein QOF84_4341 [Streptomyces sp.]|nr:hypothetical protein [Streptomyces sp.]
MQGASGHGGLDSNGSGRLRRTRRLATSLVGLTAVVMLAAACSDGNSTENTGVSVPKGSSSPSATASGASSVLAYAQCMRKHGVTNFPDPNAQGHLDINGDTVDMKSSQAVAADKACKTLLPPAGNASPPAGSRSAALKYSECMRKNGVPKFPDPNAEGGIDINGETLGVDPEGSVFKAADKICQPIMEKAAGGQKKEVQSGAPQ